MLLFLIFIASEKYNIKFCKLDNIFIQTPACFSCGTNVVEKKNTLVTFGEIKDGETSRTIKLELTPGLVFNTDKLSQEIVYLSYADLPEQYYEIIPTDFISCYRIVQNSRCITYDEVSDKYKLEECAHNYTQLFEFDCVDCIDPALNMGNDLLSRSYIAKIEDLENNMGRLDIKTYEKLLEIEKIMKNVSRCFTVNGICFEHSVELRPLTCFSTFDMAHHLIENAISLDRMHHLNTIGRTKDISMIDGKTSYILNQKKEEEAEIYQAMKNILGSQILEQGVQNSADMITNKLKANKDRLPDKYDYKQHLLENILNNPNALKDKIDPSVNDKLDKGLNKTEDCNSNIKKMINNLIDAKDNAKERLDKLIDDIDKMGNDKSNNMKELIDKSDDLRKKIADDMLDELGKSKSDDPVLDKILDDAIDLKNTVVDDARESVQDDLIKRKIEKEQPLGSSVDKIAEKKIDLMEKSNDEIKEGVKDEIKQKEEAGDTKPTCHKS